MSPPDEKLALASFVQEEMIDGVQENLGQLLSMLPPIACLRLLAFLHLVEQPSTMKATFDVHPSGAMRLTLETAVAPCGCHRH
ncbi:hypothetical protein [Microvirga pakistanensis]|uniref:hypothetical protein n=1 Tax=Microvirga pakistanensis TaxID=1682650 RepID=UPI00106D10A9|nr:hypothetical protein [Microvirga pakistanensis]